MTRVVDEADSLLRTPELQASDAASEAPRDADVPPALIAASA